VREADEAWEDQRLGAVLVGDMNSVPESSPIRFVKGLEDDGDGKGTLWVDAWEYLGAKPELEMTNIPAVNRLAAETCLPHGLDPQLVPARRIDYAFTHEYNYGGPGSPVDFGQWCDQPAEDGTWVSDHSGVWVDVKIS
jgi:endonuclease/exonuclease/phosphatase family metal-dependent hydrolase